MRRDFYSDYFRLEDRHWWFVGRRRIFLSLLEANLPSSSDGPRRILDIGCGTGTMLGYLDRYGQAEGIDADPDAIHYCRRRGVDRVQLVEPGPLPFESSSFDLVTILDVLEHAEDDAGMLAETRRILRPGGLALISVPAYMWLWGAQDQVSHHQRRYTAPRLRGELIDAGFEVRRLSYFNTLLFLPIAAIRLARRLVPQSAEPRSDFEMTTRPRSNRLLARTFGIEEALLLRRNLPFGVSILAIASVPASKDNLDRGEEMRHRQVVR
jgi:SAM-dependent methyltransferase